MSLPPRSVAAIAAWVVIGFAATGSSLRAADEKKPITYDEHVASILKKSCATCHGDAKQESGLNLATYTGVIKGSGGGSVVLFDVATGKRLASVADEPDAIIAADISPDEKRVAVGCTSRLVKLYSNEDGSLVATSEKHTDWVTAAAFSPDGRYLTTGDRAGNIHLCDAASGHAVLQLAEHKAAVRALSWRSDSAVMASCGEDGTIVWWDVKDGWPMVHKPHAHPPARPAAPLGKIANGVLDAAFGPQGQLASCGRDGKVRLWSDDGRELKVFSIDDDTAGAAAPAPAGATVLPTRVAISADGSTVLAGDTAGRLHAWPTR